MIYQPVIKKVVSGGGSEGWYPPADWGWNAASALIGDGDNGFVGLIAVYPALANYCAILLAFSGTATIFWGDGTSESITSDVKAQHQYDYALVSSAPTSEGYKAAVVRVVSTGAISKLLLGQYHDSQKAGAKGSWLAYKFRSTYSPANTVTTNFGMSEYTALIDLGQMKISSFSSEKRGLLHLNLDPSLIPWGVDMFSNSNVYNYDFSAQNWSALISMVQMFHVTDCSRYNNFEASIPLVTSLYFAFRICYMFREVILHDSGNLTEMYGAFNANDFIRRIEIDDCSAVNSTTAAISCANLESLILTGLTVGIIVSNCNLSTAACNAFLTALGTANGTQTINLAGNPGALTCDVSIGTAKGYTIITA